MDKLSVVLDINVILRAISRKSTLSDLLDKLYFQEYTISVSTEILFEYEETITEFYGKDNAKIFLDFLIS